MRRSRIFCAILTALVGAPSGVGSIRAQETGFDLADSVWVLVDLLVGGLETGCAAAADVNGDRGIGITDALSALEFLFRGGPPPPAPFPGCGPRVDAAEPGCERDQPACS